MEVVSINGHLGQARRLGRKTPARLFAVFYLLGLNPHTFKNCLSICCFFFVLASRNSPIGTDSVEVGRRWVGRSSYSFAETVFVIWTNLTLFETCAIVRIPWVLARKRNSELLRSPHTLRFVSYPKVASKQQEPIIIHFWRRLI